MITIYGKDGFRYEINDTIREYAQTAETLGKKYEIGSHAIKPFSLFQAKAVNQRRRLTKRALIIEDIFDIWRQLLFPKQILEEMGFIREVLSNSYP